MTQDPTKSPAVSDREAIARWIDILGPNHSHEAPGRHMTYEQRSELRAILARLAPAPEKVVREALERIASMHPRAEQDDGEPGQRCQHCGYRRKLTEPMQHWEHCAYQIADAALAQPEAARESQNAIETVQSENIGAKKPEAARVGEIPPSDMDTAPKDGTMVRLLVDYTDGGAPLEDAERAWTIGFNNRSNTGEDVWQFAGWCWTHDHFTHGTGTPVGWLPWSNPSIGGDK